MHINWSYSTINMLRKCERQFAFAKVVADHGFKTPLRRKAYELKQMKSLTMWAGSVVDYMMESRVVPVLKQKKRLDVAAVADQAIVLAREQFEFSRKQKYRDPTLTKSRAGDAYCIIQNHELEQSVDEQALQKALSTIHQAILNLPTIEMPNGQQSLLEYLHFARTLMPNVMRWNFGVDTAKVSPQIDLVVYDQKFHPAIIDWKVSESQTSDYSRQLIVCGLALYNHRLANKDKVPYRFEDIQLYEVNLWQGQVKQHDFTTERANATIDYIYQTYCDVELLVGTQSFDQIDMADFDLTDNDVICQFCPYRTLCVHMLANNQGYDEKKYFESLQNWQLANA